MMHAVILSSRHDELPLIVRGAYVSAPKVSGVKASLVRGGDIHCFLFTNGLHCQLSFRRKPSQ